ncbi:CPBP family intramembrane glutamic endopeptidase [Streptococcus mitis]|nr:CPBP family intramembrane glutamic endopeptidase [Streptococcus mitis]
MDSNLRKFEIIIVLISVAFFPLLSIMLGDAIIALLLDRAGMLKMMLGERILFAGTSLLLWWILEKGKLINIRVKQFISYKQVGLYILQITLITIFVFLYTTDYNSIIYILFFILVNFIIAWEEEFVYRLLVPEILKKLCSNFFIICLIQSLIFSYLGHMDGIILENLIYRVPISIVLYGIRSKTDSIFLPTTIHALWNIMLDFI